MSIKGDPMSVEKIVKKDKNQNIQVVVRLRPANNRERDLKCHSVVEVPNHKEVVVKPNIGFSKKFTFDRAFGPSSAQVEVYHEVVSPLISEVLNGYNCTVFAYGQTGTGKTHTMVGENTGCDLSWQNDPLAGIIPRALSQIFDELRVLNSEYTIRVSYLELYNEELFDLLSTSEDNSKLRIYEDSSRKGSNIVNGLEEVTVYSKSEVYKIMEKGQDRRRIASTLMNAQSSRSHTVFTIVVHMKENSVEGEELMKIGKLNLVDLAGSENISKAGTDNPQKKERARECVNINQSLLTLGRVITALVERHPHIPYRESKLTRLLQESLGGRTKTSIIATISPGHKDMEETLSTLEYAHRAKNIQNKPEVNQKLTKKAVLKEYSEEIDRLKRDLQASRDKNGVYLASESYNDMLFRLEDQEKEIQNKILEIKALMDEKDRLTSIFNELSGKLQEKEKLIETTTQDLSVTKNKLHTTNKVLSETHVRYQEQCHLVIKHVETESALGTQAYSLLNTAEQLNNDVSHLHDSVDKRRSLEDNNLMLTRFFGEKSKNHHQQMKDCITLFVASFQQDLLKLGKMVDSQYVEYLSREVSTKEAVEALVLTVKEAARELSEIRRLNEEKTSDLLSTECEAIRKNVERQALEVEIKMNKVLAVVSQLAEFGVKDKKWLEGVKNFVACRQNVQQNNHTQLRANYDKFYLEIKSQFNKLTEAYKHDMDEQMVICNSFKSLNEQQQKEMEERTATLTNVLSLMKTELDTMSQKNKNMHIRIAELNAEKMKLLQQRQEDFAALITSERAQTEDGNALFISTLDEAMKSEGDFVTDLVEKLVPQTFTLQQEAEYRQEIQTEIQNTIGLQKKYSSDCITQVADTIDKVKKAQNETIDSQHEQLQIFTERCSGDLTKVSISTDDLLNRINHDSKCVQSELTQDEEKLISFRERLHESLIEWDGMESNYMSKEYKVYSPTGKTPNRKAYQYPKQLVATSPHDRILKRFRATQYSSQNDSVTIDLSESALEASPPKEAKIRSCSSASSLSDDSACIFVEPAAKTPPNAIEKCTSESDIYKLMDTEKKTGKENFNRSATDTKAFRSKLRQPSTKKVLSNCNN